MSKHLIQACKSGDLKEVQILYKNNEFNKENMDFVVYTAALFGHLHILKWLHKQGINIINQKAMTISTYTGKTDIALYLRSLGASNDKSMDKFLDQMIEQKNEYQMYKKEFMDLLEEGESAPHLPQLKRNMSPADMKKILTKMLNILVEKKRKIANRLK